MKRTAQVLCLAAIGISSALAADPAKIDWAKIRPTTIPLFYPGQSSHEWVRSPAHKGATKAGRGVACTSCHDDVADQRSDGDAIVGGNALEPTPVKGKNGDRKSVV